MQLGTPEYRDAILAKLRARQQAQQQAGSQAGGQAGAHANGHTGQHAGGQVGPQSWQQPPIVPPQIATPESRAAERMAALRALIAEYMDDCMARGLSSHTLDLYQRTLDLWATHCAEHVRGEPSRQDVRHYLHLRAEAGIAVTTRYVEQSVLHVFYRWAKVVHGRIDITGSLPYPRLPKLLPKHLTEDQARLMCEAEPLGTPERALVEFLYATGCRVSEAANLRWSDIDFEGCWVTARGKGNKMRQAPFGVPCRDALLAWQEAAKGTPRMGLGRSDKYVWTSRSGYPITSATAERWVREIGVRVLGDLVTPHMFRHSAGTHLSDNGADIRIVQHILGHESAQTTTRYANVTPARQRSVYERVMDGLQAARGWVKEDVEPVTAAEGSVTQS